LTVAGACAAEGSDWPTYQRRFVSPDGRVIDPMQQDRSHSEGQGYGLLLAARHRDRATFDRILQWSESNLQVRKDALFAWSWGLRRNGSWTVIDYNNATDGDLLIALALLEAHDAWRLEPYRRKAADIITAVRARLAWEQDGFLVLAPAYYGFDDGRQLVVNSGYTVLPAFREFAAVDDRAFWQRVERDSLRLLEKNRFTRWQLPADWLIMKSGEVAVDTARTPFFGYEAIRVPLYLLWSGETDLLRRFSDYVTFVDGLGYLPNRINLVDGSIAAGEAPGGFYAVFARCAAALGRKHLSRKLQEKADARIGNESKDYYSHTLYLLSKEAF